MHVGLMTEPYDSPVRGGCLQEIGAHCFEDFSLPAATHGSNCQRTSLLDLLSNFPFLRRVQLAAYQNASEPAPYVHCSFA